MKVISDALLVMKKDIDSIYSQSQGCGYKRFLGALPPDPLKSCDCLLAPSIKNMLSGPWFASGHGLDIVCLKFVCQVHQSFIKLNDILHFDPISSHSA